MWNYLVLSAMVTLLSLLFRHNLSTPRSVVDRPRTDYDYVIGERRRAPAREGCEGRI